MPQIEASGKFGGPINLAQLKMIKMAVLMHACRIRIAKAFPSGTEVAGGVGVAIFLVEIADMDRGGHRTAEKRKPCAEGEKGGVGQHAFAGPGLAGKGQQHVTGEKSFDEPVNRRIGPGQNCGQIKRRGHVVKAGSRFANIIPCLMNLPSMFSQSPHPRAKKARSTRL